MLSETDEVKKNEGKLSASQDATEPAVATKEKVPSEAPQDKVTPMATQDEATLMATSGVVKSLATQDEVTQDKGTPMETTVEVTPMAPMDNQDIVEPMATLSLDDAKPLATLDIYAGAGGLSTGLEESGAIQVLWPIFKIIWLRTLLIPLWVRKYGFYSK